MSSRPLDTTLRPDDQDPEPGPLSEQALADLERRRNLLAAEMSRLSAALDEALNSAQALHVDEQWESAASAPPGPPPSASAAAPPAATSSSSAAAAAGADVTQQLPRLRSGNGGSPWARPTAGAEGPAAPDGPAGAPDGPGAAPGGSAAAPGSAARAAGDGRPGRGTAALAAVAVAAVVLLAVVFVLQRGRGVGETANTGDADLVAASEAPLVVASEPPSEAASAAAVAPSPLAASPIAPSPLPTNSPALEAVLVAAATSAAPLPAETQALVTRVPGLQLLTGPSRAEEAADIYGLAVIAARGEDTPGPATLLRDALEPEVTFDALAVLAQDRPEAVGVGVAALLPGFARLPTAPAGEQRAQAQSLLDAMMAGVLANTISPGFCNVGAHVLEPYLEPA